MYKSNKARAVLVSPHCTTIQKRQSCRDKTRPAASAQARPQWEEGTLWGGRIALKLGRAGGDGGRWWHDHMQLSEHTDLNTKTASFYYMWIIIRFYKLIHTWNRKNEIQDSTCTPGHTQCCHPPSPPTPTKRKITLSLSQWKKTKKGRPCKRINFKP